MARGKLITDDERVRMALLRFGSSGCGLRELVDQFGRDPAVISRAIRTAFEKGLVEIRATSRAIPEVNALWSGRLTACYAGLIESTVVDCPDSASSDDVHRLLGNAAAHLVSGRQMIRSRDIIGFGGGRAVYACAESFAERGVSVSDLRVVSVVGDAYVTSPLGGAMRFDANFNVNTFARALHRDSRSELRMLSSLILVQGDKEVKEDAYVGVGLDWNDIRPDILFAGLGILDQFSALKRLAAWNWKDSRVAALGDTLRKLDRVARNSEVAEIAHCYFPIGPVSTALGKQIDELNRSLLSPTVRQLEQIREIVLIAGTSAKATGIRAALQSRLKIRYLITDLSCAKMLCG